MALSDETLGGIFLGVWYLIVCVGIGICLHKANRQAWKGFVPIINAIELCRLAGLSGWLVLSCFVPIANLFVPIYVALKVAQRFGASDLVGIALGLSGFTLLPILGHNRWQYQSDERFSRSTASTNKFSDVNTVSAGQPPIRIESNDERRASRIRMIVLTLFYSFSLLCIPGMMIIGAMAFGGATPAQVEQAGPVVGLFCLTPLSLLIALVGGWILHAREEYRAATSLVALPLLNALGVFFGFIWVMG